MAITKRNTGKKPRDKVARLAHTDFTIQKALSCRHRIINTFCCFCVNFTSARMHSAQKPKKKAATKRTMRFKLFSTQCDTTKNGHERI